MATEQFEDDLELETEIVDDDALDVDILDDDADVEYDEDYDVDAVDTELEDADEEEVVDEEEDDGLDVAEEETPDTGEDDEEDEDDDDVVDLDDDDVDEDEETLEVLLGPDTETTVAAPRARSDDSGDAPPGEGEFTCRSCFLVKRRAQLADADAMICLDCA